MQYQTIYDLDDAQRRIERSILVEQYRAQLTEEYFLNLEYAARTPANRFADEYQRMFGEIPSDTLVRIHAVECAMEERPQMFTSDFHLYVSSIENSAWAQVELLDAKSATSAFLPRVAHVVANRGRFSSSFCEAAIEALLDLLHGILAFYGTAKTWRPKEALIAHDCVDSLLLWLKLETGEQYSKWSPSTLLHLVEEQLWSSPNR